MLFRPPADQRLDAIHALLAGWNSEADRFRQAAIAARRGEAPGGLIIAAVEETHDGLLTLLEDMDTALAALPLGHADFVALMRARNVAVALLESVGHSYDVLDGFISAPEAQPVRIAHARPGATA